jgi:hypothetical protein
MTGEVFYQACADCTRGIRFMFLERACKKILDEQKLFRRTNFKMPIEVPSHIAKLRAVEKVLR